MSQFPTLQLSNQDGRKFHVRLVRKFETCGAQDDLIHQQEEPLIEIFDAQNSDEESDNSLGYFTGIRCFIGTFFTNVFERGGSEDVLFNEYLPMWNISEDNIHAVREWISTQLRVEEEHFIHQKNKPTKPARQASSTASGVNIVALTPREATKIDALGEPNFATNLYAVIQRLDELESHVAIWQEGYIAARIKILHAKQSLLEAVNLLKKIE